MITGPGRAGAGGRAGSVGAAGGGHGQVGSASAARSARLDVASAASAASVSAAIRRSVRSSAPVSTMSSRSCVHPGGVQVRVAEPVGQHRPRPAVGRLEAPPRPGRCACLRAGRRRPACRSRPGRRRRRARRRAAGTPRPAADRTPSRRVGRRRRVGDRGPEQQRPLHGVLRRLEPGHRATPVAATCRRSPGSSTSRYCPTVTSVRIWSKTGRARASAALAGRRVCNSSSDQTRHRSPSRIAARVAERRPGRRPSRRRVPGGEPAVHRRLARPDVGARPSRRRGSGRWPVPTPARPRWPPARRSPHRRRRGNPSRRRRAADASRRPSRSRR